MYRILILINLLIVSNSHAEFLNDLNGTSWVLAGYYSPTVGLHDIRSETITNPYILQITSPTNASLSQDTENHWQPRQLAHQTSAITLVKDFHFAEGTLQEPLQLYRESRTIPTQRKIRRLQWQIMNNFLFMEMENNLQSCAPQTPHSKCAVFIFQPIEKSLTISTLFQNSSLKTALLNFNQTTPFDKALKLQEAAQTLLNTKDPTTPDYRGALKLYSIIYYGHLSESNEDSEKIRNFKNKVHNDAMPCQFRLGWFYRDLRPSRDLMMREDWYP